MGLFCGWTGPRVPAPDRLRLSGYRRGAGFQPLPRGYFGRAGTSATRSRARRVPPARCDPPAARSPARGPAAHLPPAMACAAPATYSSTAETGQRERSPARARPAPLPPPARAPALRPRGAPTFLPSRSLTWPSTSAASVIFCHGSRRPPRPLRAPRAPEPRVTFKITPGGPRAAPGGRARRGGRGAATRGPGCAGDWAGRSGAAVFKTLAKCKPIGGSGLAQPLHPAGCQPALLLPGLRTTI